MTEESAWKHPLANSSTVKERFKSEHFTRIEGIIESGHAIVMKEDAKDALEKVLSYCKSKLPEFAQDLDKIRAKFRLKLISGDFETSFGSTNEVKNLRFCKIFYLKKKTDMFLAYSIINVEYELAPYIIKTTKTESSPEPDSCFIGMKSKMFSSTRTFAPVLKGITKEAVEDLLKQISVDDQQMQRDLTKFQNEI